MADTAGWCGHDPSSGLRDDCEQRAAGWEDGRADAIAGTVVYGDGVCVYDTLVAGREGRSDRPFPRIQAPGESVVYIASRPCLTHRAHPYPASRAQYRGCCQALPTVQCIPHAGSAVNQGLLARPPARAVRAGDPALWEKMRAGVPALVVWARHACTDAPGVGVGGGVWRVA